MKGNQTNEVITDKNIKSNNSKVISNKQILELYEDLVEIFDEEYNKTNLITPWNATYKLVAKGYHKERVGKWMPTSSLTRGFSLEGYMFCSECDVMLHTCDDNRYCLDKLNYCPMCGAKMKGE